jgi:hypothetical protein
MKRIAALVCVLAMVFFVVGQAVADEELCGRPRADHTGQLGNESRHIRAAYIDAVIPSVESGTTKTITKSEMGRIYDNQAATSMQTWTLPSAADCKGMEVTFVIDATQPVYIDPQSTDRIGGLTNSDGDRITGTTPYMSITLLSNGTTKWITKHQFLPAATDAWSDAN